MENASHQHDARTKVQISEVSARASQVPAQSAVGSDLPPKTDADFHDEWFQGQDPEQLMTSTLGNLSLTPSYDEGGYDRSCGWSREKDREGGWRQPRFIPGKAYERGLAKERMIAPIIGGRSKKAQLGSIAECWGPMPKQTYLNNGEDDHKGMFELLADPPSRNVSPFQKDLDLDEESASVPAPGDGDDDEEVELTQELLDKCMAEAWTRARRGTAHEAMKGDDQFFAARYGGAHAQGDEGESDDGLRNAKVKVKVIDYGKKDALESGREVEIRGSEPIDGPH